MPRLKRIIFDNTISQKDAVELVKDGDRRVDLVTALSPLQTLEVAQRSAAKVVKNRDQRATVFGLLNMRKTASPWKDVRLRRAVNFAINRADLIQYAAKGNGLVIPALVPVRGPGYDPDLALYPFDPAKARELLRNAGYPDGLGVKVIAPEDLPVQATVIGKMLEHVGFSVDLEILDLSAYAQKTRLDLLDQPAEQQSWDIALIEDVNFMPFPPFDIYRDVAFDGPDVWMTEDPELRRLYEETLRTLNQRQQQGLLRQMERRISEQAYFLFLYQPVQLFAVSKEVTFVPNATFLILAETSVTAQHGSVRSAVKKE